MVSLPSSSASRQIKKRINQVKKWLIGEINFRLKTRGLNKTISLKVTSLLKNARLRLQPLLSPSRSKLHTHSVALGVGSLMFIAGTYLGIAHYLLPAIRAAYEATHQMPYSEAHPDYSTAFNRGEEGGLVGYDDGGGAVIATANEVKLNKVDAWWQVDYQYKKPLAVTNLANEPTPAPIEGEPTQPATLASGTTMRITVNTAALVTEGKLQANCNDLRIVYSADDVSHQELARSIQLASGATNCSDSTATIVAFPLQTALEQGGSESGYAIYYGNETVEAPAHHASAYDIKRDDDSTVSATLVCPFNGTTECLGQSGVEQPSTATGAIRYSGGSALSFDGKDDYVSLDNNLFSRTEGSIEFWFKGNGYVSGEPVRHLVWVGKSTENGGGAGQEMHISMTGESTLNFYFGSMASNGRQINLSYPITTSVFNHIAVMYSAIEGSLNVYINGILQGSTQVGEILNNEWNAAYMGRSGGLRYAAGLVDEVRISDTVRYTENFTPQTTPFEPDEHTALLLHFDENGSDPRHPNLAIDASGNGNHGTINGAKYVSGLVGVDSSASDTGALPSQSYASHQGIFIEEGTTNKITNPSFEHTTWNTNWGLNYFNHDVEESTFTPNVAKRNGGGPFAAGVMVGGEQTSSLVVGDKVTVTKGSQIASGFYQNLDANQGSIVFWVTPEWDGDDGIAHNLFHPNSYVPLLLSKNSSGNLFAKFSNNINGSVEYDVSGWTTGTTYLVVVRWDSKNFLQGLNYISITVNDDHIFGSVNPPSTTVNDFSIGSTYGSGTTSANAIIEGLTIYRRPLFDGTYGIDVGNGNEIEQIYNSGTGQDPTLITGSWDVVFALPTDASAGSLGSGTVTGQAWTHPHASNLFYTSTTNTGGFMMNGDYTADGWSDQGTPTLVEALSTAEKIFAGGYKYSSNAANQGIKYTLSSQAVGRDYVVRALAHSDGTSIPKIQIWDTINDHEITQLTGTVTSTRESPDVLLFTFELPYVSRYGGQPGYEWVTQDSSEFEVRLINTEVTGTTYWHQVEALVNRVDNPSMVWLGDTIPGWSNSIGTMTFSDNCNSGGSCIEYEYSGPYAWSSVAGSASGGHVTSNFFAEGFWYDPAYSRPHNYDHSSASPHYLLGVGAIFASNPLRGQAVRRNSGNTIHFRNSGTYARNFVDDYLLFELLSVPLTVTPASQENSTEDTGLRVDGADTLTQPITDLSTTSGTLKFQFTPRHSFDIANNFGISYPVIFHAYADVDNYLKLHRQDDTTLRLTGVFAGTTVNADYTTPTLSAGTTYNIELNFTAGGSLSLVIDGVEQASAQGVVAFATTPTTAYFGTDNGGANSNNYAGTFANFVSHTPSEYSTSTYTKFGSKSAQLVNAGVAPDEYTISINPASTATHTLSAYVYDGTTGNVGGEVSSSVAKLVFNNVAVTPTVYTDMGGGWWRLVFAGTTADQAGLYGAQVQAGKNVYVDGVQLEAKGYATTFTDGSLGDGYSWSGVEWESQSTRVGGNASNVDYSSESTGLDEEKGTISIWLKPLYLITQDKGWSKSSGYLTTHLSSSSQAVNNDVVIFKTSGNQLLCNWSMNSGVTLEPNFWYHVVVAWDSDLGERKCYVNGSQKASSNYGNLPEGKTQIRVGKATNHGAQYPSEGPISDLRIFSHALTPSEVSDLYYQGLSTHTSSAEQADRYNETGTYTSPVIDLNANGAWGAIPASFTDTADPLTNGSINYFTRTRATFGDWSDWQQVTNLTGSNYSIASDPRRYLQWKANFSSVESNQTQTPIISGMSVNYIEDTTPPDNPTVTALGYSDSQQAEANLTSGNWYNHSSPKFVWDPGEDPDPTDQSQSGIHGYHVLLTQTANINPIDHTGDNCYSYIADPQEEGGSITVGTNPASCVLSDGIYYLYVQSQDNSGNINETPAHLFTYKYDGTIPGVPASVSSTTVGYSAQNSFDFFWPAAVDVGGSGISHYEYKTGTSDLNDPYSDWQVTSGPDDRMAYAVTAYTEGQNLFYVRTVDNAGNYSAISSNVAASPFYFNESAPTAPTNLTITPVTTNTSPATSNVFTVSWDRPESFSGEIAKYYYCVNCTPSAATMTETTSAQTVERALANMALATQQGKNTFYLVAEDNNINASTGHGNRNFDAYTTAEFYASTTAPAAPTSLSISDTSDRDNEIWRLTLVWDESSEASGVSRYDVYRSTDDGDNYAKIGNVSSGAYTDTNLTFENTYHYKVTAVDNAGSESIYSNVVSLAPVGKYTDPPSAGGVPTATVGSTTATISWQTSRSAFGTVEYGKGSSYGSAASSTIETASHSIKITGLAPGTDYHYRVHSLDDSSLVGYDRAKAYSDDFTFTTLNQADISSVEVTDAGLDFAVIQWDTSSLASSLVSYGLTTEYGEQITVSTTPDESTHTARLSNLDHSTKYHFRIQGVTADETDIYSEDYTFNTLTFPVVTAMVMNTDQAAAGATLVLAWATNVPTTGTVQYQPVDIDLGALTGTRMGGELVVNSPDGSVLNVDALQALSQDELALLPAIPTGEVETIYQGELSKRHIQRISGLKDGAMYVITVRGTDEYGNEAIGDPIRYVTGADTRPPEIQNLIIETPISGTGAEASASIIVSWETDEPAYGQVLWGIGAGAEFPNSTEKTSEATMKHVLILRDLQPTQSYHLKVEATDIAGNITTTDDMVIVTPTAQQAAFDIVLRNLEDIFGFLK